MKTKDKGIVLFLVLTAITVFGSCLDPVSGIDPLKLPVKMTITSQPYKLVYDLNENPDWAGLKVSSICLDGSARVESVDYYSDISGFDSSSPGVKTITVTKNGLKVTFTVTINSSSSPPPGSVLVSLSISSWPDKLVYQLYESPDWTGLEVTGTYSDGSARVESVDYSSGISGFDSSSPGVKTITVTKNGVSAAFTVTVIDPEAILISLSISSQPDKLVYQLYESPDWTGLEVTGTYSDGSTMIETIYEYSDISGFDSWSTGEKTITVSKNGISTTFTITVIPALDYLAISTHPDKLVYELNESLDLTGLMVRGHYSDGDVKIETIEESDVTGFDSANPGVQTITITKRNKDVTFTVEVLDSGTAGITILPPPQAADIILSVTGNTVTVPDGYTGYQWFVDDMGRAADSGSDGRAITLSTPPYSAGKHRVRIIAYKQGLPYSGETVITLP
jgi:hypothetical protein